MAPQPGDNNYGKKATAAPAVPVEPIEEDHDVRMNEPTPSCYSEIILNMDDYSSTDKDLTSAVLYWKTEAEMLRAFGFPLFNAPRSASCFDEVQRVRAREFHHFLDNLIVDITDEQMYYKLRLLIAQGESLDIFKRNMRDMDYSLKCNVIWENDSVAYRCNTCALTPCMSLCADCFHANGHEGHDFTRFFSREGGACDCGNSDVLLKTGFCHRHGEEAQRPPRSQSGLPLVEFIYAKLFAQLFHNLRGFVDRCKEKATVQAKLAFVEEAAGNPIHEEMQKEFPLEIGPIKLEDYDMQLFCDQELSNHKLAVTFLLECVNYGGPMREAMSKVLLDTELYSFLTKNGCLLIDSEDFRRDLNSLITENCVEMFGLSSRDDFMKCNNFLEELVFWTMRLNFPQNIVNLSLSMLSEREYLKCFSVAFFTWYPLACTVVQSMCNYYQTHHSGAENVQQMSSRIIHISVQMLSSAALCKSLDDDCDLVNTTFTSALYILAEKIAPTKMSLHPKFKWYTNPELVEHNAEYPWEVITIEDNAVIMQHGYWFVMGDIQNLMSHAELAISAIRYRKAFRGAYVQLLSAMQGIHVSWRIISGNHVEQDQNEHIQRSFSLEYETLAITMYNFVTAIQYKSDFEAAIIFFDSVLDALKKWFISISGTDALEVKSCPGYAVSMHLPLHRHLSIALSHFNDMIPFKEHVELFRDDEKLLRKLLLHPTRIQVARAEQSAGMWVRNGQQLRVQSMIYAQPHICMSFLTPDIDLIRYCAANVESEWFISCIAESFHFYDFMRLESFGSTYGFEDTRLSRAREYEERYSTPEPSDEDEEMEVDQEGEVAQNVHRPAPDYMRARAEVESEARKRQIESYSQTSSHIERIMDLLKQMTSDNNKNEVPVSDIPRDTLEQLFRGNSNERICELIVGWKGENCKVLTRLQWVDVLLHAALLLLSELVVITIDCGANVYETIRMEMIHCLSEEPHTFSRLRGAMAEKGSRGGSEVDKYFEDILKEIADFTEPKIISGQMRQGVYMLKRDVFINEFCPVLCQMRATSLRSSVLTLQQAEEIETERLTPEQRQKITSLWTPYRLYSNLKRFDCVKGIADILITNRFTQLGLLTIMGRTVLRDPTIQLVVYLLTIAAQTVINKPTSERQAAAAKFKRIYRVRIVGKKDRDETSVCSAVYAWFLQEAYKQKRQVEAVHAVLSGELMKERICGGVLEYVGRLLAYLFEINNDLRDLLKADLASWTVIDEVAAATAANDIKLEQDKRLAAKRRRDAVIEATKRRNEQLMRKHMLKEGLSQDDVDKIDTSKKEVRLYDCPICADLESPSTLKAPLGLFVTVSENQIADRWVSSEEPVYPLIDNDGSVIEHKRDWRSRLYAATASGPFYFYRDMICVPDVSTEFKTCGHTAHIECFNSYREAVLRPEDRAERRAIVSCPVCRYAVNGILPVAIDWGFQTSSVGDLTTDAAAFSAVKQCLVKWKKECSTVDDRKALEDHYSIHLIAALSKMEKFYEKREQYKLQSVLVNLIKSNVERYLAFEKLGVKERRKNTRRSPVEHFIPATVAKTSRRDTDVCLAALRDLFMPDMLKTNASAVPAFRPGTSSTSGVFTGAEFALTSDDLPHIDDVLGGALSDAVVLRSSPNKDPEEHIQKVLEDKSSVPLLCFDQRALLVRLMCFVVNSDTLSLEDKRQLLIIIAQRIVGSATAGASIWLLLRVKQSDLEKTASETNSDDLLAAVARQLICRNSMKHLQTIICDEMTNPIEIETAYTQLKLHRKEFIEFTAELFVQSKLFCPDAKESIVNDLQKGCWSPSDKFLSYWVFDCLTALSLSTRVIGIITQIPLSWRPASLLELPSNYDTLFTTFFRRICLACSTIPANPLICLLCGALVCLDECCRHAANGPTVTEVEMHSSACGGNRCVFIALNTSLVIVVEGAEAAIYGSVFLDSHGEEDRNLRRGKPLFLSEKRMQCLLDDWAEQEWQRVSQWVPVASNLVNALRDAHYWIR